MKKINILILILFGLSLFSCDKLRFGKKVKVDNDKKGVVMDVIKADALQNNPKGNKNLNDMPVMEDQSVNAVVENNTNVPVKQDVIEVRPQKKQKELPYVSEVNAEESEQANSSLSQYETKTIKSKTVVVQPVTVVKVRPTKTVYVDESMMEKRITLPKSKSKTFRHNASGTVIIIGNDRTGQKVSPRHYKQLSFAVVSRDKRVRYVEFQVFAINVKSRLTRTGDTMIGYHKHARLINGQAEFTRYWNGKNVREKFFGRGRYNIYLLYKLKDAGGRILARGGRYWGNSRKYYLRLY